VISVGRYLGLKRDEITEVWRRLHNEELYDLCPSSNFIRVIKLSKTEWAGHAARMGDKKGVYRVSVGRPEGRRPLARPRSRWEEILKLVFSTWNGDAWSGLMWPR
jgi:hypothetical protein